MFGGRPLRKARRGFPKWNLAQPARCVHAGGGLLRGKVTGKPSPVLRRDVIDDPAVVVAVPGLEEISRSNIMRVEPIAVPQIETAAVNHRMRPRGALPAPWAN